MVYSFLRALPGDRAFLASVACGSSPADLTPASGRQDHTTSPSALHILRQVMPKRPSHPAPRFVTIAKRLFGERGTARVKAWFPNFGKTNIFARGAGHGAPLLKGRSVLPVVPRWQHSVDVPCPKGGQNTTPDRRKNIAFVGSISPMKARGENAPTMLLPVASVSRYRLPNQFVADAS
jgi:hypothetical protein